jgi:hypothetical protein
MKFDIVIKNLPLRRFRPPWTDSSRWGLESLTRGPSYAADMVKKLSFFATDEEAK